MEISSYCDIGHIWTGISSKHCWLARGFWVGWGVLCMEYKELYILLNMAAWALGHVEGFCPALCGTVLGLWSVPRHRYHHQEFSSLSHTCWEQMKGFAWGMLSQDHWWAVKCKDLGGFLWYNPVDFKLSSGDGTRWAVILWATGNLFLVCKNICLSLETGLFTNASARLLLRSGGRILSMHCQVLGATWTFSHCQVFLSLMSK